MPPKKSLRRRCDLRVEPLEARRVLAVSVAAALPDLTLPLSAPAQTIDLAGRYDDTAVTGTVVRFDVNTPAPYDKVYVELFDQAGENRLRTTPATVANFLSYVDGGHYQNTFIHRSVPGFVVQGGGFTVAGSPVSIGNVTQFAPVVNEPKPAGSGAANNVRGTIAMAKLGSDPNSATNQWFFNLADNSANLDAQNGGFTVFGRVLGSGMAAVDEMAKVPRFGYASPFDTVPLRNVPGANPSTNPTFTNAPVDTTTLTADQFVKFPQIARSGELVYTATSSNRAAVDVSITPQGRLQLAYGAPRVPGATTITVRATSVFNASDFVEDSFTVTLQPPPPPNALVGRSGAELVISRSAAGTVTTAALAALPTESGWKETLAGDFNGDGRGDVACRGADGRWWVTLTPANGTTATPAPWGTFSTVVAWQFLTVGDFNGDGRADIAGRVPSTGVWRVAQSTGSAFSLVNFATWSTADTWTTALAGDFDGDGKTDLAGRRSSDGGWFVSQTTGTGVVTTRWGTFSTVVAWQFLTVGDFNGDGRADIAGRVPSTGVWRVAQSTSSAFSIVNFATWSTAKTWTDAVAVRA
jgi:peptidyl-prolyl cis-trans isomerase A (cyclophilin A)